MSPEPKAVVCRVHDRRMLGEYLPGDGQLEVDIEVGLVVVFPHSEHPRQAKVRDLDGVLRKHEDVTSSQISEMRR